MTFLPGWFDAKCLSRVSQGPLASAFAHDEGQSLASRRITITVGRMRGAPGSKCGPTGGTRYSHRFTTVSRVTDLLKRLAATPGVYRGRGDGLESGPFVARITV